VWPEIFVVFGVPLRSFGFFVALGFLVGVQLATRLSRKYGSDPDLDADRIPDLSWTVLLGVLIGARIAYVLVNLDVFLDNPIAILKIWEGGLVMYGGLILALILGLRKTRKLEMNPLQTADYALTAAFLGQAVGRIGCLAVGDDFGKPVALNADGTAPWWAVTFDSPLRNGSAFPPYLTDIALHPTQMYMSIKALTLFAFGMWLLKRKKFHGQVMVSVMAGYAVLRSIVEIFRGDAQARGGIFRDGLSPEDVGQRLHELGVATPAGRIVDYQGYRKLLMDGVEGVQAELLISTSQMVAIVTFTIMIFFYRRLAKNSDLQVATD
jgi:phosphatidylglycerol---prolipoprotein diacylglyceryl transferase